MLIYLIVPRGTQIKIVIIIVPHGTFYRPNKTSKTAISDGETPGI